MAIKGAVLGDILGSQYEFNRPKNLDWQNIPLIIDEFGAVNRNNSAQRIAYIRYFRRKADELNIKYL